MLQLGLLLGLLAWCAPASHAQVSYAGNSCGTQVTSANPTCTFNNTQTSGNYLWAFVYWASTSQTLSNVTSTCTTGNWTLLNNPTTGSSGRVAQAYAQVTSTTAGCVVTAAKSGSSASVLFGIEAAGVDTGTPVENAGACNFQSSPGTGTDAVTSTAETTTAADFIAGATVAESGNATTYTQGTGFTSVTNFTSGFRGRSEYLIQSGAGSQAATFTSSSNVASSTCMAQFMPATGGGGGTTASPTQMMMGVGD
jgi:hypothetical protein